MEQFNLEKYLENPSRKITTRYGDREVRIICTDRKAKLPIVALMVDMDGNEYVTYHTTNGWCNEEEKYSDKRDLFFADEEGELTEFDYAVLSIISDHNSHTDSIEAFTKRSSKKILDLAKKELETSYYTKVLDDRMVFKSDLHDRDMQGAYELGKQDALKSLPKWKKATEHLRGEGFIHYDNHSHRMTAEYAYTNVEGGEYYLSIDDLKTLPKEE